MRQPGEPSVEEILESIKRVIAREDRAGAPIAPEHAVDTAQESEAGGDEGVLDLATHGYTPLMADPAARAVSGSLDALAATARTAPAARDDRGERAGLEPLVRELLRPALAEWLDRHLPAIVERMVAAEIARIAGGRD